MKITVCAKCGSQDLERLAWVLHRTNQYIDDHILANGEEKFYCNNCGDGCDVMELKYLENYGSAYKILGSAANKDAVLIYYPMMVDDKVSIEDDIEVDLCRAFDDKERQVFFRDMMDLFDHNRAEVLQIFRPYIDAVAEFVTEATHRMVDNLFSQAHEEFKTKSGDISPMQEVRLDEIKDNLANLVTEQVKQNL